MKNKTWLWVVIGIVVIGGGAFFGGMKYAQSKTPTPGFRGPGGATSANGQRRVTTAARGQFITGQITSNDGSSITVQSMNGNSQIVYFSSSTTIGKMAAGSVSDLGVGKYVSVGGDVGSEGVVTAQSIQVSPAAPTTGQGGGFRGAGGGGTAPATAPAAQ